MIPIGYQARRINPLATVLSIVTVGVAVLYALLSHARSPEELIPSVVIALIGFLIPYSLMMAYQWEGAVVLRLGKLRAIKGPGLFFIIPVIESVALYIDQRIQTTEFNAEQALTRDTVPVNVDAIVFWQVHDTERAALEIVDYKAAIQRVSQTTLRETIGSSPLTVLLSDRKKADEGLKEQIGKKIGEWGITVISVEIRDVSIPQELQDAMSRQAQAEREKEARVILGSAEAAVAQKFVDAAEIYASSPAAMQLRAMNIVYETTKERGATILIPTVLSDAMNPGGILGLAQAASAK
jgi:regulator of protease activity HflC (stomatin/prohibitin superfamily)